MWSCNGSGFELTILMITCSTRANYSNIVFCNISFLLDFPFCMSCTGSWTFPATIFGFCLTDPHFQRSFQVRPASTAASRRRTFRDCWYHISADRMPFLSPSPVRAPGL